MVELPPEIKKRAARKLGESLEIIADYWLDQPVQNETAVEMTLLSDGSTKQALTNKDAMALTSPEKDLDTDSVLYDVLDEYLWFLVELSEDQRSEKNNVGGHIANQLMYALDLLSQPHGKNRRTKDTVKKKLIRHESDKEEKELSLLSVLQRHYDKYIETNSQPPKHQTDFKEALESIRENSAASDLPNPTEIQRVLAKYRSLFKYGTG